MILQQGVVNKYNVRDWEHSRELQPVTAEQPRPPGDVLAAVLAYDAALDIRWMPPCAHNDAMFMDSEFTGIYLADNMPWYRRSYTTQWPGLGAWGVFRKVATERDGYRSILVSRPFPSRFMSRERILDCLRACDTQRDKLDGAWVKAQHQARVDEKERQRQAGRDELRYRMLKEDRKRNERILAAPTGRKPHRPIGFGSHAAPVTILKPSDG